MAEEQKPVVVAETPAVEPAVTAPVTDAPAAEAAPAEPAAADAAAPAEETKAAEPAKVAEPIYSGALGYKGPGVLKSLIFSKKQFWFNSDAVPHTNLNSYLRGEKPDIAHPVAAWSSQTGKGLLYFSKHGEDKKNPTGVLNLADATDLKKDGATEFSFKHNGSKHTFETKQLLERDGWYLAFEQAIDEAKAAAEEIKNSEGYKEVLEKLNKPAAVAAAGATSKAEEKLPKKSAEVKPAEGETRPSSSESEGANKKKSKSKSRSISRGKRNSIFGSFLGKKEDVEAKKEEKKEEKAAETAAPAAEASAPVIEAPVVTEEAKPAETAEAAPAAEASTETTETPKAAPAPIKTGKRNSVIGTFFEKIRSPTHEKKQSEVVPAVPAKEEAKEPEAPAAEEAAPVPAVEVAPAETTETAAAPVEEAKPAEAPATTPKKEKKGFSFDKVFGSVKEKVKSPTAEKAPVVAAESSKTEEAPKIEAEAPATEAATEPAKTEEAAAPAVEPATEATAPAAESSPKEKRKSSFFGSLTGTVKKEKKPETNGEAKAEEKEKHPSKLSGLFRNPSKAVKSKKEKEAVKTEETGEASKEEAPAAEAIAPVVEAKEEGKEEPKPAVIGDVVPEAVTVGQAPSSTPAVQAAA